MKKITSIEGERVPYPKKKKERERVNVLDVQGTYRKVTEEL